MTNRLKNPIEYFSDDEEEQQQPMLDTPQPLPPTVVKPKRVQTEAQKINTAKMLAARQVQIEAIRQQKAENDRLKTEAKVLRNQNLKARLQNKELQKVKLVEEILETPLPAEKPASVPLQDTIVPKAAAKPAAKAATKATAKPAPKPARKSKPVVVYVDEDEEDDDEDEEYDSEDDDDYPPQPPPLRRQSRYQPLQANRTAIRFV